MGARACRRAESGAPDGSSIAPFHRALPASFDRCPSALATRPRSTLKTLGIVPQERAGALLNASGFGRVMRGWRQNRRSIGGRLLFLNFQFRGQDRWRGRGNGHVARLGATVTVENFRRISGGYNFCQRGQRRPHDVHSPNQLVGTSVRKYLIHYQRFHLECLGLSAAREREAPRDVVNQQPVGLSLLLDQLHQLCPQLRVCERFVAYHDQVALSGNRLRPHLSAAVPVRMREPRERRPRHFEALEHTMIDEHHALPRHTFVVVLEIPQQILFAELLHRWIIHDAQEVRQDWLVDLLRECLPLIYILLTMAFRAVSENFMKENRCRPAREQGGPYHRFIERRHDQPFHLFPQLGRRRIHRLVIWRLARVHPVEVVVPVDVHPVARLALNEKLEPVTYLAKLQLRSLGI